MALAILMTVGTQGIVVDLPDDGGSTLTIDRGVASCYEGCGWSGLECRALPEPSNRGGVMQRIKYASMWPLVGALACQPVQALEAGDQKAASLAVLDARGQELARGESGTVAVQAFDSEGVPVNGARVFFLATDTASLSFEGEDENDLFVETTREGQALGLVLAGLATATFTIAEDAPEDVAKIVVGLIAPSTDPPGEALEVVRLPIAADEPDGGGGSAGAGG